MKAKEIFEWMKQNPEKPVYDKYGNWIAYYPKSSRGSHIEYNYVLDPEESIWDMDVISVDEFLNNDEESEFAIE